MLCMASGVVPELGPIDTIAVAKAAGFDGVGLWVEPDLWSPTLVRDVQATLKDSELQLIDVEVIWLHPGPLPEGALRVVDIGIELGAQNILVVSSDMDLDGSARKLASLCDHAGDAPIRIALEFGPFAGISSLAQARGIIDRADHNKAALLFDPFHLFRTGGSVSDLQATPNALISYAQICDARRDPQGVLVDRALPGEGVLPLNDFVRALPAGLPLSVEVRSAALYAAHPDVFARACLVAEKSRHFLSAVDS